MLLSPGVMSPATARKAMDWKILITIGAALAVSKAMEKAGVAEALANALMGLGGGGEGALIAVIYLTTMILSQVSNVSWNLAGLGWVEPKPLSHMHALA